MTNQKPKPLFISKCPCFFRTASGVPRCEVGRERPYKTKDGRTEMMADCQQCNIQTSDVVLPNYQIIYK